VSFVDIKATHGRLEGLLWAVDGARAAAVVCHPHPQHGGTMHNHVTYRLARAFRDHGVTSLRFNFRGVGRSTGVYDEGRGELADAVAALDFLQGLYPELPLYGAGFSFGARVALQLGASDARVKKLLAAGLAVSLFDYSFVTRLAKPIAFIQAERDEYGPLAKVEALLAEVPAPHKLFVVPASDHLCTGRLKELEGAASEAVRWLLAVDDEGARGVERQG
jgi:alpha/beta superfamily hydrolase